MTIGKARVVRQGSGVAILVFGTLLNDARTAADALDATLVDMRFVKPLDEALILQLAASMKLLVTVEENAIKGGAGSAVNELLHSHSVNVDVLNLGLPDVFLDHGKPQEQRSSIGLDGPGLLASIRARLG